MITMYVINAMERSIAFPSCPGATSSSADGGRLRLRRSLTQAIVKIRPKCLYYRIMDLAKVLYFSVKRFFSPMKCQNLSSRSDQSFIFVQFNIRSHFCTGYI